MLHGSGNIAKNVHDLLSVKVQTGNNKSVGFHDGEWRARVMFNHSERQCFSGKNDGE